MVEPSYIGLAANGEIRRRALELMERLQRCDLCPRSCQVDRRVRPGVCGEGVKLHLASAVPHHGEEPVISGVGGSGTVFLSGCNLACIFCQNHQVSQVRPLVGEELTPDELGRRLIDLMDMGCHNINWVSPSHVVPQVLLAIDWAARHGLNLPLVWNSNAYERVEVLRQLEGIVDVYLPDLKYGGDGMAHLLSGVKDYWATSRAAIKEMDRQVGPLALDSKGLVRRGLIVRHLVLPHNASGTAACLNFIASHLSGGVALSLMAQYYPVHRARGHPLVGRQLTGSEYQRAVELVERYGLKSGWIQDIRESPEHYRPDFCQDHPFEPAGTRK